MNTTAIHSFISDASGASYHASVMGSRVVLWRQAEGAKSMRAAASFVSDVAFRDWLGWLSREPASEPDGVMWIDASLRDEAVEAALVLKERVLTESMRAEYTDAEREAAIAELSLHPARGMIAAYARRHRIPAPTISGWLRRARQELRPSPDDRLHELLVASLRRVELVSMEGGGEGDGVSGALLEVVR